MLTDEVINIFKSLVFGVEQTDARKLLLTVPSWRATKDISIAEDLVEEIGRMVGYASITPQAPAVLAAPVARNLEHEQHSALRATLTGQGFTEVSNYSFISDADAEMFGYATADLLQVANPIIAEQKYMRPSLLPAIRRNLSDNSRFFNDFRLFEIGREYSKGPNGAPVERTHLVAAIFGRESERRKPAGDETRSPVCCRRLQSCPGKSAQQDHAPGAVRLCRSQRTARGIAL